ncbi:MAG: choice-of-anchor J domain-containing protein [Phycisphaerales bacterium]|nr:choice-of-anchor J domain-containing protein [Phycisphaerales bacterium]MCB9864294.1 choice-of-anchor J domain-containing protein [Phycisphaerales bacterium]
MKCKMRQIMTMAVLGVLTITHGVMAQADYFEEFDNNGTSAANGPTGLVSAGWVFRNQCENGLSTSGWFDSATSTIQPQAGAGCLVTQSIATIPFIEGGALSNWAILPPIPNQQAGDVLSFFLYGTAPQWADQTIEVRYSPSGGIGTGSSHTDVGDFTTLLAEFATDPSWRQVSVPLPGNGRLAIRQADPYACNFACAGVVAAVDSLAVASAPLEPCGIPLPQPGQTVTWGLADSPVNVCEQLTISPGGTVEIEPGVVLNVEPGAQLVVSGTLRAAGTQTEPIFINGENFSVINPPFDVAGGVLEMHFVEVRARIQSRNGGSVLAADCLIPSEGTIAAHPTQAQDPQSPDPQALKFRIERCQFTGGELSAVSNVHLTDTDFVGGRARIAGYVYVHNVSVDGIPLEIEKDSGAQPALVDFVTAVNNAVGPGLALSGANYEIGAHTSILGNHHPVEFTTLGAGLTPGSVLPVSGNTENVIRANGQRAGNGLIWASLGLPYIVSGVANSTSGFLTIMPGVNVKYEPSSGAMFGRGTQIQMTGTAADPIRLEAIDAQQGWAGIEFVQAAAQRIQNVVTSGSEFGIGIDEGNLTVIDSVFENNAIGGTANTFGRWTARNCRFKSNDFGLVTGSTTNAGSFDASSATMPNSFVQNGVGVDLRSPLSTNSSTAQFCWWSDPAGPTHPFNPGGAGDIANIGIDRLTPFLMTSPSYTDQAPIVAVEPGPGVAHVGDRIIINWRAEDDQGIVAQRVEYSQAAGGFPFQTIAQLDPSARSYEFDVQSVPPTPVNSPAALRVVAVDSAGQESWDVVSFWVPYQDDWVVPTISVATPGTRRPGDFSPITWSPGATATVFLEADGGYLLISSGGGNGALSIPKRMPYASTDLGRVIVRLTFGAGGREEWYYSDYFNIRPDDNVGDAPPMIALTAPQAGGTYGGGSVVPITWTAADDEALRSFDIQASFDDGRTWWTIARELPGNTTSYDWQLPESQGIGGVRVRVMARDSRFQLTTAGMDVSFEIAPGTGPQAGDINGDGVVNVDDILPFAAVLVGHPQSPAVTARSDLNLDGIANGHDVAILTQLLINN